MENKKITNDEILEKVHEVGLLFKVNSDLKEGEITEEMNAFIGIGNLPVGPEEIDADGDHKLVVAIVGTNNSIHAALCSAMKNSDQLYDLMRGAVKCIKKMKKGQNPHGSPRRQGQSFQEMLMESLRDAVKERAMARANGNPVHERNMEGETDGN